MQNNHLDDVSSEKEVESLISQAARGDTGAFGHIYDLYADRIYRHIYYRTGNTEDARDLTQDVFTRAWQGLPKYKQGSTPFLGWLFTVSHNRVIDYYRTKKDYSYLDADIEMAAKDTTPEGYIESQFSQQQLRRAILQLPRDMQQVIIMTFIEGYGYREVAAALNKNEGNVRVLVHRALKKMRDILKQEQI